MEKEFFLNRIECEFAVITQDKDCNIVTRELSIEPKRYFNKGDKRYSKFSTKIGYAPYGMWAHASPVVVSENIDLSHHFNYFRQLLESKIDIINKFKKGYGFECVFSINIKTEFATGIDIHEEDLSFINKIASRFSCSILEVESLE